MSLASCRAALLRVDVLPCKHSGLCRAPPGTRTLLSELKVRSITIHAHGTRPWQDSNPHTRGVEARGSIR